MKLAQNHIVRNQPYGGAGYFDLDVLSLPVHGAVKLELWDHDKRSADDLMCTLWIHTDYLPGELHDAESPALTLTRAEIDGPHLTAHGAKRCKQFDEDFRVELYLAEATADPESPPEKVGGGRGLLRVRRASLGGIPGGALLKGLPGALGKGKNSPE